MQMQLLWQWCVLFVLCSLFTRNAHCSLAIQPKSATTPTSRYSICNSRSMLGSRASSNPNHPPQSRTTNPHSLLHRAQADHLLDSCHIPQEPSPSMVAKLNTRGHLPAGCALHIARVCRRPKDTRQALLRAHISARVSRRTQALSKSSMRYYSPLLLHLLLVQLPLRI